MKTYSIDKFEKFKINPISNNDLPDLKQNMFINSYIIVIKFIGEQFYDIQDFVEEFKKQNDVIILHYHDKPYKYCFILFSSGEYFNHIEKIKKTYFFNSYNLLASDLPKYRVENYIKNLNQEQLYDICDNNISMNHIFTAPAILDEKLSISPMHISDLDFKERQFDELDINEFKYNDMEVGYVVFVRYTDYPYLVVDNKTLRHLIFCGYDYDNPKFLVRLKYSEQDNNLYCSILSYSSYMQRFPKDEDDSQYDIVKIYKPSILKTDIDSNSSFNEYYKFLIDELCIKTLNMNIRLDEKFSINPIKLHDLPEEKTKSYIIWMDYYEDTVPFIDATVKTKDNVVIINTSKFIVMPYLDFIECTKIIEEYPCDVFVCDMDVDSTKTYLSKISYDCISMIRKQRIYDNHIQYVCHSTNIKNIIFEKLSINPIEISNLSDAGSCHLTQLDLKNLSYTDIKIGDVIFINFMPDLPWIVIDYTMFRLLGFYGLNQHDLFLYSCVFPNTKSEHSRWLNFADYKKNFPHDNQNKKYDIYEIYRFSENLEDYKNVEDIYKYLEHVTQCYENL